MKRKAPSKPASGDDNPPNNNANKQSKSSVPDYGTKEYWEARYKSNKLLDGDTNAAATADESTTNDDTRIVDGIELSSEVQAGHAWYFSYDELRPLIVGLVLDTDEKEVDVDDYLSDDGSDGWEEVEEDGNEDEEIDVQSDSEVQETESNDEIDPLEARIKQSTEHSRSKIVLEIGCGDVPLGASLANELNSLQLSTSCNARNIVKSVECIDYSEIVIDDLKKQLQQETQKQQKTKRNKESHPPIFPTYTAADARNLPHTSNSISLILEKGTLDAMLSHPTEGITNSISIIKEMARVCELGGAILIVSHLNARGEKGMGWVNDVLLVGLKEEWTERRKQQQQQQTTSNDVEVLWSIEVHGGEVGDSEDENEADEEQEPDYGPAVYILKKKGVAPSIFEQILDKKKEQSGDDSDEVLPVKLEFLTYS